MLDIFMDWFGIMIFSVSVYSFIMYIVNVEDIKKDYDLGFSDANLVLDNKDLEQKKAILIHHLDLYPLDIQARLLLDQVLTSRDRLRNNGLTSTKERQNCRMNAFHGHKKSELEKSGVWGT